MASEKKRKMDISEMIIDDCGSSRSRSSMKSLRFLPEDLLMMIFLCLPADIIYDILRFVCRQWYNIIQSPDFISLHLQKSTIGLFINRIISRTSSMGYILKPISNHGCGVEVKELNFKHALNIRSSCNGLVFVLGPRYRKTRCPCYVANLVTKQYLPLPMIPDIQGCKFYLAYAAASRVYKVLCSGKRQLILTVGVDRGWREVNNISHLTSADQLSSILTWSSISIRGYLYWVQSNIVPQSLLRFDIETETFMKQLPLPILFHSKYYMDGQVFALGSSLCLSNRVDDYSFKIWLLKDPENEVGQWETLPDIKLPVSVSFDTPYVASEFVKLCHPRGWLRSGELLVLMAPGSVLVYNVKTGEFNKPKQLYEHSWIEYAHVESLVPINNLSLMTNGHPNKIRISRSKIYSKDNMRAEF